MRRFLLFAVAAVVAASLAVSCTEEPVEVSSVSLDKTAVELLPGGTEKLNATVAPDNAADKSVSWSSSDSGVVTVDMAGAIKAVAVGQANITAKAGTKTAVCKVTVKPIEVDKVELNKSELSLLIGGSETLTATISPGNATDGAVSWSSSDPLIAAVDAGKVTALAPGEALITAMAGSKSATCKVKVLPIEVDKVELDKSELKLTEGETAKLTATVSPTDATDPVVNWTSADEQVASVDQEGNVKAVAIGETTVYASAGAATAGCHVVVEAAPITGICVEPQTVSVTEGKTYQLEVSYTPSGSKADKGLDWASTDTSIAKVDENGLVTAVKPGTVQIHARLKSDFTVQSYATVTVTRDETLRGIALNPSTLDLKVGKSRQLEIVYTPEYASNKSVSWKSADNSVASVSAEGVVTAHKVGQTVITATSEEGGFTSSCELNVREAVPDIYTTAKYGYLYLNGEELFKDYFSYGDRRVVSNGTDLYVVYAKAQKEIEFYKNDELINKVSLPHSLDFKNFKCINNKLYALAYCDIPRIFYFISCDLNTSEIKYYRYDSVTDSNANRFFSLAADKSGNIYSAGCEYDVFNTKNAYLLKISSEGVISKQVLPELYCSEFITLDTDDAGNIWMAAMDKDYSKVLIYKNGSQFDSLDNSYDNLFLKCKGSDLYIVATEHNGEGIKVYKNQKLLYKIDYLAHLMLWIADFTVSDSGDIYICGYIYDFSDSTKTSVIWKNNKEYISLENNGLEFYSIAIVE